MVMDIDYAWIMSVYFMAVRIGVLLMMSPIFSGLSGLVSVRVLLTLMLSVVLVSVLPLHIAPLPVSIESIVRGTLGELATGAVMAFGVYAAFAAFSVAGKIIDIQSGFGIGGVYDPVTKAGAPLFATMLNMTGVVCFFAMDAHHAFLRGIAFSFEHIPPGSGTFEFKGEAVVAQFGLMFTLGIALIVPAMLCMLLVDVGLAIVSRVLPQMNVIIVLGGAKVAAGLAIFAMTVGTLSPVLKRVFESIFIFWERILH